MYEFGVFEKLIFYLKLLPSYLIPKNHFEVILVMYSQSLKDFVEKEYWVLLEFNFSIKTRLPVTSNN